MIEGEDLELFERSLRSATEQHTGQALDVALAELGWHDALSFDPRAAVSRLFELQGEAGATSSALDHVVAFAIGRELDGSTSVALPAVGRCEAPGLLEQDRVAVRGLATAIRPSTVVVAGAADRHVVAVANTSALDLRPVRGVDPALGLVEVAARSASTTHSPSTGPARSRSDSSRSPMSSSARRGRRSRSLASTHSNAFSSGSPSPASKPSATAWPRRSWRSRRRSPCSTPRGWISRR